MVELSANRLLQTRIAFWRLLIAVRIFRVRARFGVIDVRLSGLSARVSSARALLAQRVGGVDVACLRNRSMPPERLRKEVGD